MFLILGSLENELGFLVNTNYEHACFLLFSEIFWQGGGQKRCPNLGSVSCQRLPFFEASLVLTVAVCTSVERQFCCS